MLALIPLFPFLGFLVNATLGRRLPKAVSGGLASLAMVASFIVAALSVWNLAALAESERHVEQTLYTWMASGDFTLDLTFALDPLSAVMILVITGIGSLIHIYSTSYMHDERDSEFARYFSYLNLFAAFMLVLVLGANFVVMFVGWEGVGLCSFLLISFWFKKKSAGDAGKKAFVVNRIGDYAFLLGMFLLFTQFGTLDFQGLAAIVAGQPVEDGTFGVLSVATLLLFIGATGKSAQIPLYTWLPDAMEGPTPVSALIHAATMVTAGVYMIGRNAVLFSHAPETMLIVAVIGAATALFAGTIGLVQNDIKRVLAYSTVSQLGYMFLAMGMGAFGAGIFHLYTHAFFKACLFLGSGAVIHALHGEQDIRNMGGLKRHLPVTYWTFLIASLAIAGVPGLAGFFSKDEILYETFAHGHTILWFVGALTSLLTATYMFRLVFLTFHGERRVGATADGHGGATHDGHGGAAHDGQVGAAHDGQVGAAHDGRVGAVQDGRVGATVHGPGAGSHGHGAADSHRHDSGSHGPGAGSHGHSAADSHRHDSGSHQPDSGHGAADSHGHGSGAPHDAPPAMAFALIVLAIGSVLAGYIGVPHALGGSNQLATWLAPSFSPTVSASRTAGFEAPVAGAAADAQSPAEEAAAEGAEAHDEAALELTLMAVSSAIAVLGIGIAAFIWLKRRRIADEAARSAAPVYRLLLNKYYVDEIYDAAVVRPLVALSRDGLWRGFDVKLVDGAVNGTAAIVAGGAWMLRRVQTGSVRTYAGSVILGVVLILGYYLWR